MREENDKKLKRAPTASFMTGVVALVFLAIGYQTALFIHTASVEKILSGRDEPDTVYVYPSPSGAVQPEEKNAGTSDLGPAVSEGCTETGSRPAGEERKTSSPDGSRKGSAVRKNAAHSDGVLAIRAAHPPRKPELFPFNPNEASQDELVRLGFTGKQAASIVNYRKKGGRFRRKTDFARSYVVSEEMYARLEAYIDIPRLDLNLADSAALDALPGIGPYFVRKIIAYRQALGGFSYTEQLMDIYHFDQEKFDGLRDLVGLTPPEPYPLWTLPADSLRRHPYIGSYAADGIVLYRKHNPKEKWTVEDLAAANILRPECVPKLARCRLAAP